MSEKEHSSLASTSSTVTMAARISTTSVKKEEDQIETIVEDRDLGLRKRPWRRHPTPWSHILEHNYPGGGTDEDPFIVTWLPGDPEDPMNYTSLYRWSITIMGQ